MRNIALAAALALAPTVQALEPKPHMQERTIFCPDIRLEELMALREAYEHGRDHHYRMDEVRPYGNYPGFMYSEAFGESQIRIFGAAMRKNGRTVPGLMRMEYLLPGDRMVVTGPDSVTYAKPGGVIEIFDDCADHYKGTIIEAAKDIIRDALFQSEFDRLFRK